METELLSSSAVKLYERDEKGGIKRRFNGNDSEGFRAGGVMKRKIVGAVASLKSRIVNSMDLEISVQLCLSVMEKWRLTV